ncbi:MAG TPA: hypothetical protein VGG86_15765 [Roseiarcus sp.]
MRFFSQTQNNILPPLRRGGIGVDDCAICDPSGKLSLILSSKTQFAADLGAQTVSPDQEIGLVADLAAAASQSDRNTASFCSNVVNGGSERQFNARLLMNGVKQRALQIGAMNDQICRAPAAFGAIQRHSHKFSVIRTPQHQEGARH